MKPRHVPACLLGGLLLTGLATGFASAAAQPPASGHLTGRLVMEGGPLGPGGKQPGERALSGTVAAPAAGPGAGRGGRTAAGRGHGRVLGNVLGTAAARPVPGLRPVA